MMKAEAERGGAGRKENRRSLLGGHHHFLSTAVPRQQVQGHKTEKQRDKVCLPSILWLWACAQPAPNTHMHPSLPRLGPALESPCPFSHPKSTRQMLPSAGAALVTATCSFITHPASIQPASPSAQEHRVWKLPDLVCGLVPPATNYFSSPGDCCLLMFPWQY